MHIVVLLLLRVGHIVPGLLFEHTKGHTVPGCSVHSIEDLLKGRKLIPIVAFDPIHILGELCLIELLVVIGRLRCRVLVFAAKGALVTFVGAVEAEHFVQLLLVDTWAYNTSAFNEGKQSILFHLQIFSRGTWGPGPQAIWL